MTHKDIFARTTGATFPFSAIETAAMTDSAVLSSALLTTTPALFGGGNIGRLAVNVVANRLLAHGAEPRIISATLTVDIDTRFETMRIVAEGLRDAAVEAEMDWAALDSQIIPSGPCTGIAISTFAIGTKMVTVDRNLVCPASGDLLIATGPIGSTGAVIAAHERGILLEAPADGRCLIDVMRAAYLHSDSITSVTCPDRGINKALRSLGVTAEIDRTKLPFHAGVGEACGMMDLDPLELATSDAMLLTVHPDKAEALLESVRRYEGGAQAGVIGIVR